MLVLGLLVIPACRRTVVTTTEVVAIQTTNISLDPNDGVWYDAPVHPAKLILQDLVEPRLMQASTAEVQVRAITDGKQIAFRLEWIDNTKSDVPGPKHFIDACAVQVPVKIEANVPAPQMGEGGKTVEISYWRADWQAIVDGREDTITAIYPNASVDHYPFEAKPLEKDPNAKNEMSSRYAPARSLGNRREGPRETPVEDLIAEGPATLSPSPNAVSKGKGIKTDNGWAVIITRPLPNGLSINTRSQIAFAVWEGSHEEAGARKMRTGWIPLAMK
jgi:DMSO reductase family type II enzyme heme b subunit